MVTTNYPSYHHHHHHHHHPPYGPYPPTNIIPNINQQLASIHSCLDRILSNLSARIAKLTMQNVEHAISAAVVAEEENIPPAEEETILKADAVLVTDKEEVEVKVSALNEEEETEAAVAVTKKMEDVSGKQENQWKAAAVTKEEYVKVVALAEKKEVEPARVTMEEEMNLNKRFLISNLKGQHYMLFGGIHHQVFDPGPRKVGYIKDGPGQ